jgi:threonine aldolase
VRFVDLRSDTVTQPTLAMRQAMVDASVGDDVYGEDPTVNRLEQYVAGLLGHEAALFTPTGSLANQLGIRLLVKPGEELLCDVGAHIARAELGAAATFSGITTRTWHSSDGRLRAEDPLSMMAPHAGPYLVSTTAIAVENTHNFGGGSVQSIEEIEKLRAATSAVGVSLHLDGARLWNAHIATGIPLATYAQHFDTVSVCLSKGLGAPIGSLLVASADRIREARQWRKRYGAGMRQVGMLAAAGLHALHHHLDRLTEDHARAAQLAATCAEVAPTSVNAAAVTTNIVGLNLVGLDNDAPTLARLCKEEGVLISALGPRYARLVTHLDVDDQGIDQAVTALRRHLR